MTDGDLVPLFGVTLHTNTIASSYQELCSHCRVGVVTGETLTLRKRNVHYRSTGRQFVCIVTLSTECGAGFRGGKRRLSIGRIVASVTGPIHDRGVGTATQEGGALGRVGIVADGTIRLRNRVIAVRLGEARFSRIMTSETELGNRLF